MAVSTPLVLIASGTNFCALELENGNIVEVGSEQWYEWLESNGSFRFESGFAGDDSFTARKHKRESGNFWYAYRKVGGQLKNAYVGKSENLSTERMLAIAQKLNQPSQSKSQPEGSPKSYAPDCITLKQVQDLEKQIESLKKQLREEQIENAGLRSELVRLKEPVAPKRQDLEEKRDYYLTRVLKLGKQAPKYKPVKEALDWLIAQLNCA